jgi:ABC-2 type transport system permease protein
MSIRRIGVLLSKEFIYGPKSFFFIFAIVAPLIFTLLVNLVFGSLFSGKPKLGIVFPGTSKIVKAIEKMESINLKTYSTEEELKQVVETGERDLGIVIPQDFDTLIKKEEITRITAYIWGESLLKDRAIIIAALLYQVRELSGKKAPLNITSVSLGDETSIPLKDRFLPLIVLMAIFISGFAIPSTSLVDEKLKRTLGALLTTPATQVEVFISKGLMGLIISITMGVLILVLNHAINAQLGLVILLLFLGAIMACCIGLITGAFMKDISSLYTVIKALGLFIYGPGIVHLFPQIPGWIAKLFPTYYLMNPIMQIARKGGSWATVQQDVFILTGFIALFIAIVALIAKKTSQQEA